MKEYTIGHHNPDIPKIKIHKPWKPIRGLNTFIQSNPSATIEEQNEFLFVQVAHLEYGRVSFNECDYNKIRKNVFYNSDYGDNMTWNSIMKRNPKLANKLLIARMNRGNVYQGKINFIELLSSVMWYEPKLVNMLNKANPSKWFRIIQYYFKLKGIKITRDMIRNQLQGIKEFVTMAIIYFRQALKERKLINIDIDLHCYLDPIKSVFRRKRKKYNKDSWFYCPPTAKYRDETWDDPWLQYHNASKMMLQQ